MDIKELEYDIEFTVCDLCWRENSVDFTIHRELEKIFPESYSGGRRILVFSDEYDAAFSQLHDKYSDQYTMSCISVGESYVCKKHLKQLIVLIEMEEKNESV